jgi:hypothetical protein
MKVKIKHFPVLRQDCSVRHVFLGDAMTGLLLMALLNPRRSRTSHH